MKLLCFIVWQLWIILIVTATNYCC